MADEAVVESSMGLRITWFLAGAAAASIFWLVVIRSLDAQVFEALFGMTGH